MKKARREGYIGGGVFLAIGPIAGLAAGTVLGQPSAGLVAGIAAGIALMAGFYFFSR
ncbi:hypothetical protein [Parasphingopyxis marina]|uniref:Uncharacterized protein n=1 Tax=Parasphingopyxis marina TaxID=2761622 RepID=A0A842I0P4_9SPHN|nr:hypothetical protein [Parasphingopyxis marina]MBC2778417.1 hypothetical protein [Parasphingopyxis marina]